MICAKLNSLLHQRWRVWNRSRLCVCLSVCECSHGWTVWCRDPKFGGGIGFDNMLNEVIGQRSRSPGWKKCFWWVKSLYIPSWRHMTSCHDVITSGDVTPWRHNITWCHAITLWHHTMTFYGKNIDKESTMRKGHKRSGVFILECNQWMRKVQITTALFFVTLTFAFNLWYCRPCFLTVILIWMTLTYDLNLQTWPLTLVNLTFDILFR